jgi:hypothetical protein
MQSQRRVGYPERALAESHVGINGTRNRAKIPRLPRLTGGFGKGKTTLTNFLIDYCETMRGDELANQAHQSHLLVRCPKKVEF